jgi:hypothetical protein
MLSGVLAMVAADGKLASGVALLFVYPPDARRPAAPASRPLAATLGG